jgi:predicted MPP superfamily phosphohydrolase
MFIAATVSFFIVFLGGNYAIYKMIAHAFSGVGGIDSIWAKIIFFSLALSFPFVSLFTSQSFTVIGRLFYTGSAVWLGTLHWLFLATIIFWIIYGCVTLISPGTNIVIIAKILVALAFIVSAYGVWHSSQIKVKTSTVFLENLPVVWEDRKIVLFADTHFGNIRSVSFAEKIVSLVNEQNPDMVLIPGDFFDGTPLRADDVAYPFQNIVANYGTYFAPGNHEEYGDEKQFLESLNSAGVHVLSNEKKVVEGLQVIGVTYTDTKTPESQQNILESLSIDPEAVSILIKHEPANIAIPEEFSIDLQVSGHAHKGQVFPLSYITKRIYGKFFYGLHRQNNTQVYTTSGVGAWGPPQRVGTDSEIVVIQLKTKK